MAPPSLFPVHHDSVGWFRERNYEEEEKEEAGWSSESSPSLIRLTALFDQKNHSPSQTSVNEKDQWAPFWPFLVIHASPLFGKGENLRLLSASVAEQGVIINLILVSPDKSCSPYDFLYINFLYVEISSLHSCLP